MVKNPKNVFFSCKKMPLPVLCFNDVVYDVVYDVINDVNSDVAAIKDERDKRE